MKKAWKVITAGIGVLVIGGVMAGPIMSDVESPKYEVVAADGDIEIRHYQPMIIAEVIVSGERDNAIRNGFRLLADYIFGNNRVEQDIAMTAPVQQQESLQMAMTAPVQQQLSGQSWKVSFVMPSQYTVDSLPKPNNGLVTIKELPSRQFVVVRFAGNSSDENINAHKKELRTYIQDQQLDVVGEPKLAFYNPPVTLPFFRRNEVMLELAGNL